MSGAMAPALPAMEWAKDGWVKLPAAGTAIPTVVARPIPDFSRNFGSMALKGQDMSDGTPGESTTSIDSEEDDPYSRMTYNETNAWPKDVIDGLGSFMGGWIVWALCLGIVVLLWYAWQKWLKHQQESFIRSKEYVQLPNDNFMANVDSRLQEAEMREESLCRRIDDLEGALADMHAEVARLRPASSGSLSSDAVRWKQQPSSGKYASGLYSFVRPSQGSARGEMV